MVRTRKPRSIGAERESMAIGAVPVRRRGETRVAISRRVEARKPAAERTERDQAGGFGGAAHWPSTNSTGFCAPPHEHGIAGNPSPLRGSLTCRYGFACLGEHHLPISLHIGLYGAPT
jgi:hypothetical protein